MCWCLLQQNVSCERHVLTVRNPDRVLIYLHDTLMVDELPVSRPEWNGVKEREREQLCLSSLSRFFLFPHFFIFISFFCPPNFVPLIFVHVFLSITCPSYVMSLLVLSLCLVSILSFSHVSSSFFPLEMLSLLSPCPFSFCLSDVVFYLLLCCTTYFCVVFLPLIFPPLVFAFKIFLLYLFIDCPYCSLSLDYSS